MSYSRIKDTGFYIYADGKYIHFDLDMISEDKMNVFLARLNDFRPEELKDRIIKGRKLIEQYKEMIEVNDSGY